MITRQTIPENHRPIFDAMVAQKKSSRWSHLLSEHRFNMAVILGRPLESTELVDHMDGDKSHNDPANLRLYTRGKNMPGSQGGHGTYYHEWQTALAEIERLRSQLTSLLT